MRNQKQWLLQFGTVEILHTQLRARHPSQIAMARVSANAFCPRRTHLTTGEPTIPRQPSHPITAAAADTTLATPAGTPHPPSRPCQPRPAGTIQTALREALAAFTLATRVPPPTTTLQANSIIILLRETTTTTRIIIMTDQLQALPVTAKGGLLYCQ